MSATQIARVFLYVSMLDPYMIQIYVTNLFGTTKETENETMPQYLVLLVRVSLSIICSQQVTYENCTNGEYFLPYIQKQHILSAGIIVTTNM